MLSTPPKAPGLRVAAPLVALQGVLGLAYTIYLVVDTIRFGAQGPSDVSNSGAEWIMILIFALVSLGLLWSAAGLWRERRWARSPVVLIEVIFVIVGFQQVTNASIVGPVRVAFGVIAVAALVTLVCVFLRSSTARFNAAASE